MCSIKKAKCGSNNELLLVASINVFFNLCLNVKMSRRQTITATNCNVKPKRTEEGSQRMFKHLPWQNLLLTLTFILQRLRSKDKRGWNAIVAYGRVTPWQLPRPNILNCLTKKSPWSLILRIPLLVFVKLTPIPNISNIIDNWCTIIYSYICMYAYIAI